MVQKLIENKSIVIYIALPAFSNWRQIEILHHKIGILVDVKQHDQLGDLSYFAFLKILDSTI